MCASASPSCVRGATRRGSATDAGQPRPRTAKPTTLDDGDNRRPGHAACALDMASPPTVVYPLTLPALLHRVLASQKPTGHTTLVVCASRDLFLQQLAPLQQLIAPTLHNLCAARHVNIAFCASVQTLLAYLAACQDGVSEGHTGGGRVVLVGPLAMHAPTASYSAQGLSRTFAAAAEMALRVGATLELVECHGAQRATDRPGGRGAAGDSGEEQADGLAELDPWEQDVTVLNLSPTRFASGNADRAWAGRTVKVKRVAARWFRFHRLETPRDHEGPHARAIASTAWQA